MQAGVRSQLGHKNIFTHNLDFTTSVISSSILGLFSALTPINSQPREWIPKTTSLIQKIRPLWVNLSGYVWTR